jgi:predicted metal-dependent hydrolase
LRTPQSAMRVESWLKSTDCGFAHLLSRDKSRLFMDKGERISQFVSRLAGEKAAPGSTDTVLGHPYYRAFFLCWNEQRYYEAHDVLEQVWLNKDTADDDFFKGLIQAAGAFVHLQKNFEHPSHPKHGRRLRPAVRLFALAEKHLAPFAPMRHGLDVDHLLQIIRQNQARIIDSNYEVNPWSPATAPTLNLQ